MYVFMRHRKEWYVRNWKRTWWLGFEKSFTADGYLFGLMVVGFFLRYETVHKWQRERFLNFSKLFWYGVMLGTALGLSCVGLMYLIRWLA